MALVDVVEGQTTPSSGETLRVFVPSIEDMASRLKQLAEKKCEVHSPTYARILREREGGARVTVGSRGCWHSWLGWVGSHGGVGVGRVPFRWVWVELGSWPLVP